MRVNSCVSRFVLEIITSSTTAVHISSYYLWCGVNKGTQLRSGPHSFCTAVRGFTWGTCKANKSHFHPIFLSYGQQCYLSSTYRPLAEVITLAVELLFLQGVRGTSLVVSLHLMPADSIILCALMRTESSIQATGRVWKWRQRLMC